MFSTNILLADDDIMTYALRVDKLEYLLQEKPWINGNISTDQKSTLKDALLIINDALRGYDNVINLFEKKEFVFDINAMNAYEIAFKIYDKLQITEIPINEYLLQLNLIISHILSKSSGSILNEDEIKKLNEFFCNYSMMA